MARFLVLIILFVYNSDIIAQSALSTNKKKAIQLYTEADNYRVRGQFDHAIALLSDALSKDENFHEAWFRLGQTFKMARQFEKAVQSFHKAIDHNPLKKPLGAVYFELGDIYLSLGDYKNAEMYLSQYLSTNPNNKRIVEKARKLLQDAQFALENNKNIADVKLAPVSEIINAFPMQYFPVLTADKRELIYTRRLGTQSTHDEDLVISRLDSLGSWSAPVSISSNINSDLNEGTSTISADGRTLIFTSCYGRETVGNCDLYVSYKKGDEWSIPINMGKEINSPAWDSQPSLSADGRTLFFVSDRAGGVGKIDIWFSRLDLNRKWSTPVNAGKTINTPQDEVSPFLHANHQTLFFSSSGHKGFGGFDVFKTEWDGESEFSYPENVGAPINTAADQISVFITADGEEGYYSYETYENNIRRSLIYSFKVPKNVRPKVIANYVKGTILEKGTKKALSAAVELYDLFKNKLIGLVYSDSITGSFLMVLPEGSQYALYVNKEGYLLENKSFNYKVKDDREPVFINFELQPLNKGASIVLNNIFFDFDSYEIRDESITELKRIVKFLAANPTIKIEIAGHTDNKGSEDYNLQLSKNRACAVYNYLITLGIPKNQVTFQGYGDKEPLVSNDSEANRQINRRIEFKVLN